MIWQLIANVIGWNRVIYDDEFFTEAWFRNWAELQPVLAGLIGTQPRWHAILDYGCGPGAMIDPMNAAGYRYVGCDRSNEARALYMSRFGEHPSLYVNELAYVRLEDFNLLLLFDVLEHLTDQEVRILLRSTRAIPEVFVNISRVRRIPGHINIKNDRRWIGLFESEGLRLTAYVTKCLRNRYRELRPGCPDQWDKNMFVFSRLGAQ